MQQLAAVFDALAQRCREVPVGPSVRAKPVGKVADGVWTIQDRPRNNDILLLIARPFVSHRGDMRTFGLQDCVDDFSGLQGIGQAL